MGTAPVLFSHCHFHTRMVALNTVMCNYCTGIERDSEWISNKTKRQTELGPSMWHFFRCVSISMARCVDDLSMLKNYCSILRYFKKHVYVSDIVWEIWHWRIHVQLLDLLEIKKSTFRGQTSSNCWFENICKAVLPRNSSKNQSSDQELLKVWPPKP